MPDAGRSWASERSMRAWTEPIHSAKGIVAVSATPPASFILIGCRGGCERLEDVAFQHPHLLLRGLQARLAELCQLEAALVRSQRLLERKLAAFHPVYDALELGERLFERQLARRLGLARQVVAGRLGHTRTIPERCPP